ncbi:MAG TPA: MoaD/ThiS family protein [Candidatus Nanoarchaeia archaeon]|nr:MoaD/ThiS family protein [Candidatus Nanoarchaeia archaeon]
MKVFLAKEKKEIEISFEGKLKELFKNLGIEIELHLAVRNNELITADEIISDKDFVKIIPVVSGG